MGKDDRTQGEAGEEVSHKKTKKAAPSTGRPTKLNAEIQKAYCDQLRTGCHMNTAAAMVGVDEHTIWKWLQRGRVEKS